MGVTCVFLVPPRGLAHRVSERLGPSVCKPGENTFDWEEGKLFESKEEISWRMLDPVEPKIRWNDLHKVNSHSILGSVKEFLKAQFVPENPYDTFQRRIRFLHTLCFLRHSRHITLLHSEAALRRSSVNSGVSGVDCDDQRREVVSKWVEKLLDIGLLRRKYGGFYWMHWEYRVRLRALLEQGYCEEKKSEGGGIFAKFEDVKVECSEVWRNLSERAATTHHWIGVWYFKSFQASRHPLPLVECLYHNLCAFRHASKASMPMTELEEIDSEDARVLLQKNYQKRLQHLSLSQIGKALRFALPALKFWMEGDAAADVLRSFRGALNLEIENGGINEGERPDILSEAWKRAIAEVELAERVLEDQAGLHSYPAESQEPVSHPEIPSFYFGRTLQEPSPQDLVDRDYASVLKNLSEELRVLRNTEAVGGESTQVEAFQAIEGFEWANSLGGNLTDKWKPYVSRWIDFDVADSGLDELECKWDSNIDEHVSKKQILNILKNTNLFIGRSDTEVWRLLQILRGVAFACLKRTKLWEDALLFGCECDVTSAEILQSWLNICEICSAAVRVSRHLPGEYADAFAREQCGVRGIYAVALGHLRRFSEAHRKLDEASSYLSISRLASIDAEWGIIHLRRAEVYLWEGGFKSKRMNTIKPASPSKRAKSKSASDQPCSNLRFASLEQAWVELERAESRFSGANRSNWWWGRLNILQIRVIETISELCRQPTENGYKDSAETSIIYRKRIKPDAVLYRLLRRGALLRSDRVRIARLILSGSMHEKVRLRIAEKSTGQWQELHELMLAQLEHSEGTPDNATASKGANGSKDLKVADTLCEKAKIEWESLTPG